MPRPGLPLRDDLDAETCRRLAAGVKDVRQARRLLSLAAAYDCMSRAEAARIGRHCATGVKGARNSVWWTEFSPERAEPRAAFQCRWPGWFVRPGALWPAMPAGCRSGAASGRDCRDRP